MEVMKEIMLTSGSRSESQEKDSQEDEKPGNILK
jgi:hypothetical protein